MSLHRYAAKRDGNESAIRDRFERHKWHTEQLSGSGMPDLIAWPLFTLRTLAGAPVPGANLRLSALIDVKMPHGAVTPAQVTKWGELAKKGVPVYVVRTEADVDALVAGVLAPWMTKGIAYRPPRTKPVDAAKEAEVFAPPSCGQSAKECCCVEHVAARREQCHADSDGDCGWKQCPQEANGRANYQSLCPLAQPEDDEC